jgi:hypothetical protein
VAFFCFKIQFKHLLKGIKMANSQAIGVAYLDQDIVDANYFLVNALTGQMGYTTGSPTTAITSVTQATSKSTGVTINAAAGQIVTSNAALAAAAEVAFVVTNSSVSAYDIPVIALASGATTAGTYLLSIATVANGSFTVVISNASTGSLSEALTLNFGIIHVAQL